MPIWDISAYYSGVTHTEPIPAHMLTGIPPVLRDALKMEIMKRPRRQYAERWALLQDVYRADHRGEDGKVLPGHRLHGELA
jgi:hypothetical protein